MSMGNLKLLWDSDPLYEGPCRENFVFWLGISNSILSHFDRSLSLVWLAESIASKSGTIDDIQ